MLQQLPLHAFLDFAKTAKRVAIFREISASHLTPIGIVEQLTDEMLDGAILESGLNQDDAGRSSLIAFDSIAQLSVQANRVTQRIGTNVTTHVGHPFSILRELIATLACVGQPHMMDFVSGAIGFFTYDAIRLFEAIPDRHALDNPLPDMLFNFYRTTLMFNHQRQTLLISMVVDIDGDPHKQYHETQTQIDQLIKKIAGASSQAMGTPGGPREAEARHGLDGTSVELDINDEQFMQLILRAKEYIVAGDAFQVVLSRCFKKRYTVPPFAIYQALRRVSPSPYMFYLPFGDRVILGASPEKLISVRDGQVAINPIAGTRQRTATSNDQHIADELLHDPKEQAEHMMLVDLARNDLGAVCKPGSINIQELLCVKHFSHVSHITSVLTGQLREDKDAFDAVAAAFPAGTLSGAPKIRAMQIIDELETSRRGMYGGAICRIDYQGNLDSCIAIRMAVLEDGTATVRTGAGIVYDSNPQSEANETRQKAQSLLDAIALAEESCHAANY